MNVNPKAMRWKIAGVAGFFLLVVVYGTGLSADPIDRLMAEADDHYRNREDIDLAYRALKKYREIFDHDPEHYEALWKFSRTAFFIAEMRNSKTEKWKVVEPAIETAKRAVKVNPNGVDGYFWLGVLYTKVGEIKGIIKSLFLIAPIKRAMRKVLAIDESYEGGGAYTVLGRIFSSIPGIIGGSEKKALRFYKKARKICPSNSLNLLFMAETYHKMGQNTQALKILRIIRDMEPDIRWKAEAVKHKAESRKLFELYTASSD